MNAAILLLVLTACLLLLLTTTQQVAAHGAYYLPGVSPHTYKQYETVTLFVSKLTSVHTQMPYDYYSLPYCKPKRAKMEVCISLFCLLLFFTILFLFISFIFFFFFFFVSSCKCTFFQHYLSIYKCIL